MAAHLPILQIVVPLVAAPACLALGRGRAAWLLALAVSWAALGIAGGLLATVLRDGPVSYALGNWAPPWGIEYRVDALNAYVLLIVAAIGAVVLPYARRSIADELPAHQHAAFYTAFLLCLTGLLGVAITGDAFNLFVFLEISSLSSYVLIGLGRNRRALTAAFQYLVMGTIGATFIVIGIGLLYMATGTLNMADLAARIPAVAHSRTVLAALAFLAVGATLKIALFPLHGWLPNAYAYAPSAVTAFLAATATKVSVYILVRFLFTVFGPAYSFEQLALHNLIVPFAVIAIVVCSTVAIFQNNVKRMLAYSSVAQIGYMMLGIGLGTATGISAGLVHLFNHALMKGGLFLALGCIALRVGSVRLEALAGLGRTMPLSAFAFVIGGLSLIGVPLTNGFISKWILVQATLEQGAWGLALVVLFGSLLAVAYIWRVVEVAYLRPPPDGARRREAPLSMLIPTWILIGASVYFGIDTSLSLGVAEIAARILTGGAG
ncbi:MAG: monovalent cation/H+ antiporter subunit D family protein [Alphaproteobacteria bacterium]|nr:MAG: monovalent cation/H+ antiporter subunit D family protein [Alphaproteobacteria bacterium]